MKFKDQLEPIAAELMVQGAGSGMATVAAQMSQAVSLKRIADVLEKVTDPKFVANFEEQVRKVKYGD